MSEFGHFRDVYGYNWRIKSREPEDRVMFANYNWYGMWYPVSSVGRICLKLSSDGTIFSPNGTGKSREFGVFLAMAESNIDNKRINFFVYSLDSDFSDDGWPNFKFCLREGFRKEDISSNPHYDDSNLEKVVGQYFGSGAFLSFGAKCVECGVFNEYALSGSGYVCGSCRSYRRMWG